MMTRDIAGLPLILLPILLLTACQEQLEVSLTPAQKKKIESFLLKSPPTPQHKIGAIVENRIELLGYDIDKTEVKPGETFTFTAYIKALKDGREGGDANDMLFVHLQGKKNDRRAWMNLDHHPVEGLLPLYKLKKGQIVKDVQTITVKKDYLPGPSKIYWGMWRGNYRFKITNAAEVKVDKEGRLVLATVNVKGKQPKPKRPKRAVARRLGAGETIALDGRLDEAAWKKAVWTGWWVPPDGSSKPSPRTRARFLYDQAFLYVGVQADDDDVWSTFEKRDANTWEQEVIELFIDADGDGKDYLELQVTPANVIFDARFAQHRSDLTKARAWNMSGLETAVHVDGTLNQRDDKDRGWTVEMKIPVAEVPGVTSAPEHGQSWRINLFRWDLPKGGQQVAAAFSPPIVPDFHALEKFGELRFVDPSQRPKLAPIAPSARVIAKPLKPLKLKPLQPKLPAALRQAAGKTK